MPGPLEQWLETFMCGHIAENFERYGYRTLQTVRKYAFLKESFGMFCFYPEYDSEVY